MVTARIKWNAGFTHPGGPRPGDGPWTLSGDGRWGIRSARRGCYEVFECDRFLRWVYLTNFKIERTARVFVRDYAAGVVGVDDETRVPFRIK